MANQERRLSVPHPHFLTVDASRLKLQEGQKQHSSPWDISSATVSQGATFRPTAEQHWTRTHSTRTSAASFHPSSGQMSVSNYTSQMGVPQMGTPSSLSSLIHLNISWLLILLFFEKWLPTSSCNRVITSHLAEKQRLSGTSIGSAAVWWLPWKSASPALLHQRNISSYFFPASSSMSSTWHVPFSR